MTKLLLLVKAHTEMWATTRTKNRKEQNEMTKLLLLVKARAEIRATIKTKTERSENNERLAK